MPINKGFTFTFNSNNGTQVPLYPTTTKSQVEDWNIGEVYGPYVLTLSASGWSNKKQTLPLAEINSNDRPICVKVLEGDAVTMKAQDEAYSLLDSRYGIESLEGQVRFTCTEAMPSVDLKVQVSWTR